MGGGGARLLLEAGHALLQEFVLEGAALAVAVRGGKRRRGELADVLNDLLGMPAFFLPLENVVGRRFLLQPLEKRKVLSVDAVLLAKP